MLEVADVFRRFAADYLDAHGASMPPSHRRAIADILDCRTAALGGRVWRCDACSAEVFSYHSCGNRSCPKCHAGQAQEWLGHRQAEMLPVGIVTLTLLRRRRALHTCAARIMSPAGRMSPAARGRKHQSSSCDRQRRPLDVGVGESDHE